MNSVENMERTAEVQANANADALPEPQYHWTEDQLGEYANACEKLARQNGPEMLRLRYSEGQALQMAYWKLSHDDWDSFLDKHSIAKAHAQCLMEFYEVAWSAVARPHVVPRSLWLKEWLRGQKFRDLVTFCSEYSPSFVERTIRQDILRSVEAVRWMKVRGPQSPTYGDYAVAWLLGNMTLTQFVDKAGLTRYLEVGDLSDFGFRQLAGAITDLLISVVQSLGTGDLPTDRNPPNKFRLGERWGDIVCLIR